MSSNVSCSPPRAPPVIYNTPHGTRWAKEKAAAGQNAFDFPDDPKFIGPWIIGECVGKGASGRVRIAKHRSTGQLAAIKILPIQPLFDSRASLATRVAKSDKQRLGIDREIAMMKLMNHPNIMRIYDVYEGDKELFLVLEYVQGGELFDFLVNRGKLPSHEALCYFKQIVYGLNYAHTFSIIHRDLKPENILISSLDPPVVKIADWGMAAFAPPTHKLETSCGSPHYASPEIVNGEKYNGTSTDVWSCGVILFALLTGRLPFDDKNVRTLLSKVKSGKFEMPAWIDPQAKDLISRMLVVDVSKRITIPEVLEHPWLLTPTEGLEYVAAPSPVEIAQPLSSPSQIDVAQLESLRIIWGRHTDPWGDSIRNDLLSPAGEGTLSKAFYFLLTKYHERVQGDNDIEDLVISSDGKQVLRQYVAPPPNFLAFPSSRDRKRTSRTPAKAGTYVKSPASCDSSAVAPPLEAPSAAVTAHPVVNNAFSSTKPRSRTSSPAGPRPLTGSGLRMDSQQTAPIEIPTRRAVPPLSPELRRPVSSARYSSLHLRCVDRSRQNGDIDFTQDRLMRLPNETFVGMQESPTSQKAPQLEQYVASPPLASPSRPHPQSPSPATRSAARFSSFGMPLNDVKRAHPDFSRSIWSPDCDGHSLKSTPASPIIYAPKPIVANSPGYAQVGSPSSPSAVTRRSQAYDWSNGDPNVPNVLGTRVNAMQMDKSLDSSPHRSAKKVPRASLGHQSVVDKENVSIDSTGDSGWMHVGSDTDFGLGLRFEMNGKQGKPGALEAHKSERKLRAIPPTLKPRRSTIALASPILLSPPSVSSKHASHRASSPLLPDAKRGWFSQLFHRRPHDAACVLYSADDLDATTAGIISQLHSMGITAWQDGNFIIRAKVDDDKLPGIKAVRFRAELSPVLHPISAGVPILRPGQSSVSSPDPSQSPSGIMSSTPRLRCSSGSYLPVDCATVVVMVHEKGSVSASKTLFRQIKWEAEGTGNFVSVGGGVIDREQMEYLVA